MTKTPIHTLVFQKGVLLVINFDTFSRLMAFDTKGSFCIEIYFRLKDSRKFDSCWMGKLYDAKVGADTYWFGLTADGKNAYDYISFKEFSTADVFDGKSLIDVWDSIEIIDINGCEPSEMIKSYL